MYNNETELKVINNKGAIFVFMPSTNQPQKKRQKNIVCKKLLQIFRVYSLGVSPPKKMKCIFYSWRFTLRLYPRKQSLHQAFFVLL